MRSGEWDPQTPNEALTPPPTPASGDSSWEPTAAAPDMTLPAPYAPPAGAFVIPSGTPTEPATPSRLARGDALDLLSRLKATLVTLSLVALGIFAALAAFHATGVTARAASSTSPGAASGQGPQASPSAQTDGGFFNLGPNGFGIGQPGSQGPAAGTTVS